MKASIILPAYNEGKNIGSVIRAVKKSGDHEIIVVDDGSRDNTLDVARAEGCVCVRLNKNMGKGYACKTGAKIATNNNLVFIDSDGQLDAKQIPSLLATLKSCDIAVGVRNMDDIPIQRKFSNKFARSIVSAAAGKKLGDVLCGFRAIRKNDLFNLQLKKGRYEFEAEMIIKAVRKGMTIKEVPVSVRYGIGSSMPITESAKVTSYVMGAALQGVL